MSTRLKKNLQKGPACRRAGFTLIELLAVLLIMSLITLSLLVEQGKFDSSTVLRSLAYSVALSVRQTQVYGVSVVGVSVSGTNTYAPAYGVYITTVPYNAKKSYLIFGDTSPAGGNGQYDAGDVVAQSFSLNSGYTISKICVKSATNTYCGPQGLVTLEILFKRPNPDAQFVALKSDGSALSGGPYSTAYIYVASPNGDTRAVTVSTTGEVAVWGPGVTPP